MENLSLQLEQLLMNWGLSEKLTTWIHLLLVLVVIFIVSWIVDKVSRKIIIAVIKRIISRSNNDYDDILFEQGVFKRLAHLAPGVVVFYLLPSLLVNFTEKVETFLQNVTLVYMVLMGVMVIVRFLYAVNEIYNKRENAHQVPIKGYIQVIQGILLLIAIVWSLSILFEFDLKLFFAGLGTFAAVLMLIFKDTILGIVASVQISANKMMSIGDWISMPTRKADGTVLDITVNTVKVQNWDKTIASIPTYAFLSESFDNWRGMEESGGRRIKRSINIDMSSVKFCTAEMLEKYRKFQLITDYVNTRQKEVEDHNANLQVDQSIPANGRRMTNLGTFRKYLEAYLTSHPKIHNDMTFLVRQLQPTDKGIPIEIYVFSNDQAWANYESIQSDIFDHILALLPEFELKVFQNPTGQDFRKFQIDTVKIREENV